MVEMDTPFAPLEPIRHSLDTFEIDYDGEESEEIKLRNLLENWELKLRIKLSKIYGHGHLFLMILKSVQIFL